MKNPGAEVALLTPDARDWKLHQAGKTQTVASLAEALPVVGARAAIHLAAPTSMALLERLTLPSKDRDELSGMVQLQLEKTLPYPIEEVTSDFLILNSTETDSTVTSLAVHEPALAQLCEPLRSAKRLPAKITIFGQQVAAAVAAGETSMVIWEEQEQLLVAICEDGKLGWIQVLPDRDPEIVRSELPHLLLAADMEGVPTECRRVLYGESLKDLEPVLRETFDIPVEQLPDPATLPEPATNLLPPGWSDEAHGYQRAERIKQRLLAVAVLYLLFLAAAFVFLAWTKRRVQVLDVEIATLQPQLELIQTRKARWDALAPAIDPSRYAVELLYQVTKARPSGELRITKFEQSPLQFQIQGEASSAAEAIAYSEKLKSEPELSSGFQITMPNPPTILPNDRAQFSIFGRP